jgi:hypothetical protein
MFKTNVGTVDRALRIVVGLALIAWFFAGNGEGALNYLKLLGILPLATGLFGTCPVYSLLSISTCPMKKA